MNVIVCDDNKSICTEIGDYINQNFDFNVQLCNSSTELIKLLSAPDADIQLVILDIVLENGINGIDVAAKLHKQLPKLNIIFLTGYDNIYYEQIFASFQPYGFIAKPIQYNILNFFLKKLSLAYTNENKALDFTSNYKQVKIPIKDIRYIQSIKRVCEIVTDKATYTAYFKISKLTESLTDSFIRCHQSYIVNLDYVHSISKNGFVTSSNDFIPISKKYYHEVKDAYDLFLAKNGRTY